jgi:hypothetical protein
MSHHQSRRERRQGDTDGASASASASATSWFPAGAALGAAGLATVSTAITCMAISKQSSDPPPAALCQQGNDDSSCCYLLALSGLFYSGIAELGAAVWVMAEPRGRVVAGRRLVYASLVPLTAVVGLLAAATLFW